MFVVGEGRQKVPESDFHRIIQFSMTFFLFLGGRVLKHLSAWSQKWPNNTLDPNFAGFVKEVDEFAN